MDNILEPPSYPKRGINKQILTKSATGAFVGLASLLSICLKQVEKNRLNTGRKIEDLIKYVEKNKIILHQHGINRSLIYKFVIVAVIALLPVLSKVTAEEQAYEDAIHYSHTLDPIESARFAVYFSGYTPATYIDADEVALAADTSNDSYTLSQQLAVNQGKEYDVPGRQDPTYVVKGGETITEVAKKFDLHVGTLVDANNLSATELKNVKPGTELKIPSSDTNTSDDWLVAINRAEEEKRQKAAAEVAKKKAEEAKKIASARNTTAAGTVAGASTARRQVSSEVTVIGTSYSQCVPWAREHSGIQIHGYAGDIAPSQSEPRVGGVALDRFYGHASVVVEVGADYIVVHEANWMRGKITERRVSRDAIRGYVY